METRGRPRNEEETCVLSVRLPVSLRDQLDRHLIQLETRTGIKASRTDMIRHALRLFLDRAESPHETPQGSTLPLPQEPPQPQSEPPTAPITGITRRALILEYFHAHPHQNISPQTVSEWARREYLQRTGEPFRDPERQLRTIASQGEIVKVSAGTYRYEPKTT